MAINNPFQRIHQEIHFSPIVAANVAAAERRAAAIFGPTEIEDPWTSSSASDQDQKLHPPPTPFKIVPSEFLQLARQRQPKQPEATASAFAQWIYSLYGTAFGSEDDRERGLVAEPAIRIFRHRAYCAVDDDFLRKRNDEWELVHCGLHLSDDQVVPFFSIDHLQVNGQALRASPDLVYRHKITGEVIVVEIKLSKLAIPSNLWPNVWGQLWCYAELPLVRAASRVTVIGEVWGARWEKTYLNGVHRLRLPHFYLRASVRRDPREPAFDRFFRSLFDVYRGQGSVR